MKYEVRRVGASWWIFEIARNKRVMGPFASQERAEGICEGRYNGR